MLQVQCPKCKNKMMYAPKPNQLYTKLKKRCVYCGSTFKVHKDIKQSRIIKSFINKL